MRESYLYMPTWEDAHNLVLYFEKKRELNNIYIVSLYNTTIQTIYIYLNVIIFLFMFLK